MLTGESLAVKKTTEPVAEKAGVGDRKCIGFSATLVQQGQGIGLVVATGDSTAIGSINALVQGEEEKPSSIQVQLELFGRVVTIVTVLLGIAAFLLAFFYAKSTWQEAFRASVAIAVAVIPEGLPAVVTITLALGVSAMASHNAIIRKLPAVETLGSVSTGEARLLVPRPAACPSMPPPLPAPATKPVCSDKTGTLTKNEMTAVKLVTGNAANGGAEYPVAGVGYDPSAGSVLDPESNKPIAPAAAERLRTLVLSSVLPNDGGLSQGAKGRWEISGDPTDVAPLVLFTKLGGAHEAVRRAAEKVKVIPFESLHKWQAMLVRDAAVPGGRVLHIKGAPERLFPLCSGAVAGEDVGAEPAPFDSAWWSAKAAELSGNGLRVIAVARWAPPADFDASELTVEWVGAHAPFLTITCLMAILDPPRAECVVAIREFHEAGIVVKMITGDHPKTALGESSGAVAGMPLACLIARPGRDSCNARRFPACVCGQAAVSSRVRSHRRGARPDDARRRGAYGTGDRRHERRRARQGRADVQRVRARVARKQDPHRQGAAGARPDRVHDR